MRISLKNLEEASAQEVFDQVAKHLLKQNKRCVSAGTCRYRQGNLRCAAGCLIKKSEYKEEMEGMAWDSLVVAGFVTSKHMHLIIDLQLLHDDEAVEDWPDMLSELAGSYDLEFKK